MRGRKRQHVTLRPTIAWRSSRTHNSDAAACRYCWGYNGEGELGTCSLLPTAVAVPIRVRRACGVGRVIVACWCPRLLAAAAVVLIERVYHACADAALSPLHSQSLPNLSNLSPSRSQVQYECAFSPVPVAPATAPAKSSGLLPAPHYALLAAAAALVCTVL